MKLVSLDELTRLIRARGQQPRIVAPGNAAAPLTLLKAVDADVESFRLFMLNAPVGIPSRAGVVHETSFVGAGMRRAAREQARAGSSQLGEAGGANALDYHPSRLSLVPALLARVLPPDVVLLNTTRPRNGTVSMGVEVNVLPGAVEAARRHGGLVVAVLNRHMPWTYGDAEIALDAVDLAVEVDEPLRQLPVRPADERQRVIGERLAALVADGATLQMGIGAIPDATLSALTARHELRIWTEMVSDGVLSLEAAGALSSQPLTTSFAAGSAELYEWLDRNQRVVFRRTEVTNDPGRISQRPRMTSINSALQVDLFAQANASYVGGRIYSGFGGQTDFIVGAMHAEGGQALLALPSWHERSQTSTIVGRLTEPATSFQHSAVVTERGVACIWGCSAREQARQLIENAADPRAREQLWHEAERLHLAASTPSGTL